MTVMEDKFNQFLSKYSGQPNVGDTPENIGQCVGLIEVWTDSLGLPHTWGNANDLLKDADPNFFEIIDNTPDNQPQVGDIIVWNSKYNGTVGHTGIATGTNTTVNKFDCFEQNDPLGSYPHIKSYSYAYIDGWMRPKVDSAIIAQAQTSGGYTEILAVDDAALALLGTHLSDDEKAFRSGQLSQGDNVPQIIANMCQGDSRFRDKWITPSLKDYEATINDLSTKNQDLQKQLDQAASTLKGNSQTVTSSPVVHTDTLINPPTTSVSPSFWDWLKEFLGR